MEKEIRRANKEYRRKTIFRLLLLGAAAAVFSTFLILWGHPFLKAYLETLEPEQALHLLTWSLALIPLSFLPLCAIIFLQGRKIIRSECYPPPGAKVIRDTVVVRGEKAIARGRLLVGLALALALLALLAAVYFPYWLNRLAASQKQLPTPGHGQLARSA
jgi:O-antigen/teichoic acid export membrane protein|uniref:Uncharacterized protein n=1 Tax=Desulfobacca acetoxidans TaxID=60893 RepID=A0A7C3SIT0_9BACT